MDRPELHLTGDRVNAQLRFFSIECPRCGRTYMRDRKTKHAAFYNPRSQWFRCWECNFKAVLGIIVWPLTEGSRLARPPDVMPTPRQGLRMRQNGPPLGLWVEHDAAGQAVRRRSREPVNVMSEPVESTGEPGPADLSRSRASGTAGVDFRQGYKDVEQVQVPERKPQGGRRKA